MPLRSYAQAPAWPSNWCGCLGKYGSPESGMPAIRYSMYAAGFAIIAGRKWIIGDLKQQVCD